MEYEPPEYLTTIEWEMMDKTKFFPLSMLSTFSIRCCFYPLTLIKTQLQVQFKNDVYSGMLDAAKKIVKAEGVSGLYRGFWISSVQIFSGVFYISTYESVRHLLAQHGAGQRTKSLVSGACASLIGQSIIVPIDVISQHIMVLGMNRNGRTDMNSLGIKINQNKFNASLEIARQIYNLDGFRGFYRGYVASLMAYVPNSALWWTFYHLYQEQLTNVAPLWMSHLFLQCIAGSLGGFTTTIITNPLDVVRARLQVQRIGSIQLAFSQLWHQEKLRMFTIGLTARLLQSATFSFSIILGYETIKRIAIHEKYRHRIRW